MPVPWDRYCTYFQSTILLRKSMYSILYIDTTSILYERYSRSVNIHTLYSLLYACHTQTDFYILISVWVFVLSFWANQDFCWICKKGFARVVPKLFCHHFYRNRYEEWDGQNSPVFPQKAGGENTYLYLNDLPLLYLYLLLGEKTFPPPSPVQSRHSYRQLIDWFFC